MQLHPQHLEELVNRSGINLHLANLNFKTLQEEAAYEYLLISELIPRNNTGMVKGGWLQRYAHTTHGGWWCSGVDPLQDFRGMEKGMEWGCFKPNQPRLNEKGKAIKYEHPPHTSTRVFCLRVTLDIWFTVSQRYNVPIPEDIQIGENVVREKEAKSFWEWVIQHSIPLIICEGVKKAATLLSQGYAAIGIPGINSGYRVIKDDFGRVVSRQLIPDLAVFTTNKRSIYICFDFETEAKKITAVSNAISQLGFLFQEKNCPVQVIELPGLEKGVDEFIVAKGAANFEKIYRQSIDLEIYFAKTKPHNSLTITPALTCNRRYLGKVSFPTSGLVGVKSAKGTGKTTSLQEIVAEAKNNNRPVLLITHRIQLGRFLCEQIGLNWGITGKQQFLNYRYIGLCVDSIWKLKSEDWEGAIVILDEVEQSLWHLLHSNTCKDKRVKVLKYFGDLISTVLKTGGLVIAQDADLSDISLDYLQKLVENKFQPWVVVNEWKPTNGWDVTLYDSPNPTPLIQQLEIDLMAGRKCYVTTDSRSGRYSCETVERYLKERFTKLRQDFPKSLVVSSQTTNTPGHEAVDFVAAINQKITDYEAVFVTPSLGTGVSIDVQHFDRVYGIFQGVIPDSEARQALARVRDDIPRIVWCAKRGIGLIGSGSGNYKLLSHWYQENQKENLALLSPLHKIDVDLPLAYDPIHLRTWAKLSARVNTSICIYRQSMKEGLIADGHQVLVRSNDRYSNIIRDLRHAFLATEPSDVETRKRLIVEIVKARKDWEKSREKNKDINLKIRKIKQQKQLDTANAIANAEDIDYVEYEKLTVKHSLTEDERYKLNKSLLRQRYGVKVTPQLKLKDSKGYYCQLLIHYYLTHEREFFHSRDKEELKQQLFWGEGKIFLPDLKTYTLKVEALRALGVMQFLEVGRKFQENDADLILLKNTFIQCSKHIKRALGINLVTQQEQVTAIRILSRLMGLLGLKLKRNSQGYEIDSSSLDDGRNEIFRVWKQRDELMLENLQDVERSLITPMGRG
ncbi:MAG: plasmid replication protein, CyRepA1 family [Cyanobacteria bacterium P01_A01_bin.84]